MPPRCLGQSVLPGATPSNVLPRGVAGASAVDSRWLERVLDILFLRDVLLLLGLPFSLVEHSHCVQRPKLGLDSLNIGIGEAKLLLVVDPAECEMVLMKQALLAVGQNLLIQNPARRSDAHSLVALDLEDCHQDDFDVADRCFVLLVIFHALTMLL